MATPPRTSSGRIVVTTHLITMGLAVTFLCGCMGKTTVSSQGPWAIDSEDRYAYQLDDWKFFATDHFITREYVRQTGSVLAGTAVTRRRTVQHNARYYCFVYDTSGINLFDGWSRSWPVWRGVGWNRLPGSLGTAKPLPPPLEAGDVRIFYSERWPYTTASGRPVDPVPDVIIELPQEVLAQRERDFPDSAVLVRVLNHETRRYVVVRLTRQHYTRSTPTLQMVLEKPGVPFIWAFFTQGDEGKPNGITLEFYAAQIDDWKAGSYKSSPRFYTAAVPSLPAWSMKRIEAVFE